MTKLRVGLLFGGRSGEHEVSINSARAIQQALQQGENLSKYEVIPFYIQKNGAWTEPAIAAQILNTGKPLADQDIQQIGRAHV